MSFRTNSEIAMNITTTTQGFELNSAIDAFVKNRLRVALKRLSASVVAIDVFAKDNNGPKGGIDKSVIIRIQLPQRQVLAIETTHENLYAAIEKGAKRSKRAVRRHLRKARQVERQRLRDLPAVPGA
jgi:ribosome-associated translation inhibitor RaiA